MKYIIYKRFKTNALCGEVNLPAMTEVESIDGIIYYNNLPLCVETSENAHQFFMRNDDSNGILRGKLIQTIQKTLNKRDKDYQKRWDKVWNDPVCQRYKRKEYDDYWLWNHDWFQADIGTLQYIKGVID